MDEDSKRENKDGWSTREENEKMDQDLRREWEDG